MYACMGVHACTYVHMSACGNSKKLESCYMIVNRINVIYKCVCAYIDMYIPI